MRKHRLNAGFVVLALAALLSIGCRAGLEGKKIETVPSTRIEESGITYYLSKPQFTVDVKGTKDKKKAEPVYELRVGFVPDYDQRYEVRLKSGSLTKDTFKLELLDDGRLASLGVTSDDQIAEIIKPLGNLVAAAARAAAAGILSRSEDLKTALDRAVEIPDPSGSGRLIEQKDLENALCVYAHLFKVPPPSGCPEKPSSKNLKGASKTAKKVNEYWETVITERFERGCFRSATCEQDTLCPAVSLKTPKRIDFILAESCSIQDYREIRTLGKLDAKVADASPSSPAKQIAAHLKSTRKKAEKAYASYVTAELKKADDVKDSEKKGKKATENPERKALKTAIAAYLQAVQRVIEFDGKFQQTVIPERLGNLASFLERQIPDDDPTGNESKAYRDFRQEFDLLATEIGAKVDAAAGKTSKKEDLQPGTEVTRTLTEVQEFTIHKPEDLYSPGGDAGSECLLLADVWLRYSDVQAVVIKRKLGVAAATSEKPCTGQLAGGS